MQAQVQLAAKLVLMAAIVILMATEKSQHMAPISLLDFHCFKPPEELKRTKEEMMTLIKDAKVKSRAGCFLIASTSILHC